jgi:hypothetical protein
MVNAVLPPTCPPSACLPFEVCVGGHAVAVMATPLASWARSCVPEPFRLPVWSGCVGVGGCWSGHVCRCVCTSAAVFSCVPRPWSCVGGPAGHSRGRYGDSEKAQLEMPRLVPYLSNGIFVLSERGVDESLEQSLEGMLVFLPKGLPRVRGTCSDC